MPLTTDPTDPRLTHGVDDKPVPQAEVYLVLSEEERAKGFVRPLRRSYIHVGPRGPHPDSIMRDLTPEEIEREDGYYPVKFEEYAEHRYPVIGKYWTQEDLDSIDSGCQTETHMGLALCETYARDPHFYGATYCCGCSRHLPVSEFVWAEDGERVGS